MKGKEQGQGDRSRPLMKIEWEADDGRMGLLWAKQGDLVFLPVDPVRFGGKEGYAHLVDGKSRLRWRIDGDLLRINEEAAGVDLTGVPPDKALALLQKHRKRIRTVVWTTSGKLDPRVMGALDRLARNDLTLQLVPSLMWEYPHSLEQIKKLRTKLRGLSVASEHLDNGLSSVLDQMEALRALAVRCGWPRSTLSPADIGALSRLKRLTTLCVKRCATTGPRSLMDAVAGLKKLRRLVLSGSAVSDAGLSLLKGLRRLHALDLSETRVSASGLFHVGRAPWLSVLMLPMETTNAGMAHLSSLRGLKVLDTGKAALTDAGLAHLKKMKELQKLCLWGRFGDPGLSYLDGLTNLVWLSLTPRIIDGATSSGFYHLRRMTRLEHLDLSKIRVKPGDLAQVRSYRRLRHLELSGGTASDAGFLYLKYLPKLRSLVLTRFTASGAGFDHMKNHPALDRIHIRRSDLTRASLQHLAVLPGLKILRLSHVQLGAGTLLPLINARGLTHLVIRGCRTGGAGLKFLQSLSRLRHVDLSQSDFSTRQLAYLANLRELIVLSAPRTGLGQIVYSLKALKKLSYLDLTDSVRSDTVIRELKALPDLRVLLMDGHDFSGYGFYDLQGGYSSLRILSIKGRFQQKNHCETVGRVLPFVFCRR